MFGCDLVPEGAVTGNGPDVGVKGTCGAQAQQRNLQKAITRVGNGGGGARDDAFEAEVG